MGSKLTVKKVDPNIETFKELLISKLKLTGYNNMFRLLQYEGNEGEIKDMEEKFVVTSFDVDEAVNRIAENREIAHVRHTTTFLYYALINPKAKGEIHVMKDCLYHYYPSFVMKKYSPVLRKVNGIIRSLREAGIVQYWRSKYIWKLPNLPEGFVKLSMERMKGLFYIVLIGEAVSIVAVIVEITYGAFVRNNKTRRMRKAFKSQTLLANKTRTAWELKEQFLTNKLLVRLKQTSRVRKPRPSQHLCDHIGLRSTSTSKTTSM